MTHLLYSNKFSGTIVNDSHYTDISSGERTLQARSKSSTTNFITFFTLMEEFEHDCVTAEQGCVFCWCKVHFRNWGACMMNTQGEAGAVPSLSFPIIWTYSTLKISLFWLWQKASWRRMKSQLLNTSERGLICAAASNLYLTLFKCTRLIYQNISLINKWKHIFAFTKWSVLYEINNKKTTNRPTNTHAAVKYYRCCGKPRSWLYCCITILLLCFEHLLSCI